jgi:hypothetical protein
LCIFKNEVDTVPDLKEAVQPGIPMLRLVRCSNTLELEHSEPRLAPQINRTPHRAKDVRISS